LLLVAPLAVVHDLADRRSGVGGDLDEVEPELAGAPLGFGGGGGTDFVVVLVDQKNRRNPDLLVVAEVGGNGANSCSINRCRRDTRPQAAAIP
jgi:hypothetical protein